MKGSNLIIILFAVFLLISTVEAFEDDFDANKDLMEGVNQQDWIGWTNSNYPMSANSGVEHDGVSTLELSYQETIGEEAQPPFGSNVQTVVRFSYGKYEARLKAAGCGNNEGIVTGFFTFWNPKHEEETDVDQDKNGIVDNHEIDFEFLGAHPEWVFLTIWRDQESTENGDLKCCMTQRAVNLLNGDIWEMVDFNEPKKLSKKSETIEDYDASARFYTYGYAWDENFVKFYIVDPSDNHEIVLWCYQEMNDDVHINIPDHEGKIMFNVWHTDTWSPPDQPATQYSQPTLAQANVDWVRYDGQYDPTTFEYDHYRVIVVDEDNENLKLKTEELVRDVNDKAYDDLIAILGHEPEIDQYLVLVDPDSPFAGRFYKEIEWQGEKYGLIAIHEDTILNQGTPPENLYHGGLLYETIHGFMEPIHLQHGIFISDNGGAETFDIIFEVEVFSRFGWNSIMNELYESYYNNAVFPEFSIWWDIREDYGWDSIRRFVNTLEKLGSNSIHVNNDDDWCYWLSVETGNNKIADEVFELHGRDISTATKNRIADVLDSEKYTGDFRIKEIIVQTRTLDPDNLQQDLENLIQFAKDANIEGISIAFKDDVSGELFYDSKVTHTVHYGGGSHDNVIVELISKAQENGIKVYAWVPTFFDPVLISKRGDLALVNKTVKSDSFVNPAHPEVQEHEIAIIKEIADNFDIDGFRIDHCRYENSYQDWSADSRAKFNLLYPDIDPETLEPGGDAQTNPNWIAWNDWRAEQITKFLFDLKYLHLNPDTEIGVYVLPHSAQKPEGYDMYTEYGQDLSEIGKLGIHIMPMVYWQDWPEGPISMQWTNDVIKNSVDLSKPSDVIPVFSVTDNIPKLFLCIPIEEVKQYLSASFAITQNNGINEVSLFYYHKWEEEQFDIVLDILDTNADIALIIDSSGSMVSNDPTDLRKKAAKEFVALANEQDQIAVVDFDSSAKVWQHLITILDDIDGDIIKAIDKVDSSGGTNIGEGLRLGYNELNGTNARPNNQKAAILLTDGLGSCSDSVVSLYVKKGWPIYTIGLSSSADEVLLKEIAKNTSGIYYDAPTPENLHKIYTMISLNIKGQDLILIDEGEIVQGQTIFGIIPVDSSIKFLDNILSWPGSDLDLTLYYPNGEKVQLNPGSDTGTDDPDITFISSNTYEIYKIKNPAPGIWSYEIYAKSVSGQEPYTLTVAASASTQLTANTDKLQYSPGENVEISADLSGIMGGIEGADVIAEVTLPDNSIETIVMTELGQGKYAGAFSNCTAEGLYCITVKAIKGDIVRQEMLDFNVEITTLPTQLLYTGDISGQYSDPITFGTILTTTTGQPVGDKIVTFSLGTQTVSATTDISGLATATVILDQPAGVYPVSANFTGDAEYLGCCVEESFTLDKESVVAEYTGDTIIPLGEVATLRATLFEEEDGNLGVLTNLPVYFKIFQESDLLTPIEMTAPGAVELTDTDGIGVALDQISGLGEDIYFVRACIAPNDYYSGTDSSGSSMIIYEPEGSFATGGGWIIDSTGSKGHFGFNAKYLKNGKAKGHSLYKFEDGGLEYFIKSTAISGLAIDGNVAMFEGKGVVQIFDPVTGALLDDEGNYQFRIDVEDSETTEGGYRIVIRDKNGVLYHEAGSLNPGNINGGSVVIHQDNIK